MFDYLQARERTRRLSRSIREVTLASEERVRASPTSSMKTTRNSLDACRSEQVALVSGAKGESGRNTELWPQYRRAFAVAGHPHRTLDAIVAALDGDEALMVESA